MPTRATKVRLTWPSRVLLTAAPVPMPWYAARYGQTPYWGVEWRRWGGGLTLAQLRHTTEFPHNEPLSVLVSAPADCEEVWASLVLQGVPWKQPCKVSPVTIVAEERHDPAAGLYYPPAYPHVLLGS